MNWIFTIRIIKNADKSQFVKNILLKQYPIHEEFIPQDHRYFTHLSAVELAAPSISLFVHDAKRWLAAGQRKTKAPPFVRTLWLRATAKPSGGIVEERILAGMKC